MQYNTERPRLVISEYGRVIQNMVRVVAKIEDDEKRNAMARSIIELMSQASPQFKNIEEYRHKLWDHLIMISDFKLVVDSPYPFPERTGVVVSGTKPLPYPKHKIRMRHYGRNLETLVGKAKEFDDEKKKAMAAVVANYMKLCYVNWSHEHVSDESIRQDIGTLSKGLLSLGDDYKFEVAAYQGKQGNQQQKSFGGKKHKKNRNFGGKFKRRRDR